MIKRFIKNGLLVCILLWSSNAFARIDRGNVHLPYATETATIRDYAIQFIRAGAGGWGLGCGGPQRNTARMCWIFHPLLGGTASDQFLSLGELFFAREDDDAPSPHHSWFAVVIFPDTVEVDRNVPLQLVVDHGRPLTINWDVCHGRKCEAAWRPEVSNEYIQSLKGAKHARLIATLMNGTKWFYDIGFENIKLCVEHVVRSSENTGPVEVVHTDRQ